MKKILITLLICTILMITLASALEFDNVKNIKETTGKAGYKDIEIVNAFGLGDTLWSGTLDSNTKFCWNNCQATQTITLHKKGSLVDEIIFETILSDGKRIREPIKSYQIYVDDVPYELGKELDIGIYNVRLEGSKEPSKVVDWMFKSQGMWLGEWAVWDIENWALNVANTEPSGITNNGTDLWITDYNKNVYHYLTGGTYLSSFDISGTHAVASHGISHNGTALHLTKQSSTTITVYTPEGVATGETWESVEPNPLGIATNVTDFWIINNGKNVTHYLADGTFLDEFIVSEIGSGRGIEYYSGDLWFADDGDGDVFQSSTSGVYTGYSFDPSFATRDLTINGTYFFMPDQVNDKVYVFGYKDYPEISINLTSPVVNKTISATEINFTADYNLTYAPLDYNWENITYYVWDSSAEIFNNSVIVGINGTYNLTSEIIGNFVSGDYEWNVLACFTNITSSNCSWANTNYSFTVGSEITGSSYNSTTYETATENFEINITDVFATPTNAILWHNGTEYTATVTDIAGEEDNYTISRNIIDIPIGSGNKTFYFKWDAGSAEQSENYTQMVNQTLLSLCNATLDVPFINFTFKDEDDDSVINNGTIPTSTFVYWLGSGSINRTYNYINNTANPSYAFCGTPPHRNLTIDLVVQYKDQEGSYPQRTYNPSELSIGNITINKTLYLLSSTDGIYVTFQTLNQAEQTIEGVIVTGTRIIGGETVNVAYGTTGSDGGVTFWLNPDFSHTFTFVATGYDTYTTTLTPTQSSYTIILGSATETIEEDYVKGISYSIYPFNSILANNTDYNFNFTISSSYWEIDEFGFVLTNGSGTSLGSTSASTNGGIVDLDINTGTNLSIIMNYYWIIEGNYSNASRTWLIIDEEEETDWSIKIFFDDLGTFLTSGMFGLDNFGLAIILFLFIFVFTGIMSYKFGLVSPAGIMTLVFTLVLFFDVGLDLMDNLNPVSQIPHFPTIFIGIILAGIFFREATR